MKTEVNTPQTEIHPAISTTAPTHSRRGTMHGLLLTLATLFFLNNLPLSQAQGTAFTYQGRLNENGGPANGMYDFTFQAFDAPSAGASIGGTVNVNAVVVTNGLFTALVDLGGGPFTGPARWLQISVSANDAGDFTTLVPRQPLTPSPYAIFANTAGTVTNGAITGAQLAANSVATANIQNNAVTAGKIAPAQVVKSLNGLTDAVSLTQGANVTINTVGNSLQISAPAGGLNLPFSGSASNSGSIFTLENPGNGAAGAFLGRVGIGTTTPGIPLHIANDAECVMILQDTGLNSTQAGYVGFWNGSRVETAWVGFGTPGSPHFSVLNARSGGNIALWAGNSERLTVASSGNIGIGTTAPQSKLEVRGDIRLGPSGEFRATSSEENLRIIRGLVRMDFGGVNLRIVAGSGFQVSEIEAGRFRITFNTPFPSTPVVTATADHRLGFGGVIAEVDEVGSAGAVIVLTHGSTDVLVYRDFHFIAIGPR